ncbi:MAG: tyrosine-type recombinase/integrase [Planctomycetota bacterium]|nr:tyrosine-type recombinase/integrase [Planctomycetota bacterium]
MAAKPIRLADADNARSLPRKLTFTVSALTKLPAPTTADRLYVYDTRQPGLALAITAGGAKVFYFYAKVKGRPQRVRLGALGELSIEQARNLAAEKMADVRRGIDPMAEKRAAAEGLTLGDAWAHYFNNHAKPHLRDWKKSEQRWNLHLATWKARRLADLDRAAVVKLHAKIGASQESAIVETKGGKYKVRRGGQGAANRILALLSTIISTAKRDLGHVGENPAEGVRRFREQSRTRFLKPDELPGFEAALNAYPDRTIRHFYRFALLTGARRRNVQTLRWSNVDLEAGTWAIPGSEFKNGQAQSVALARGAVRLLRARKLLQTRRGVKTDFVFDSPASTSGHLESTYRAWESICKAAKVEGVRPHDLRRSLAVYMLSSGSAPATIAKQLGHKSLQSTAVYARLDLQPVQAAVNAGADAMSAARKASTEKAKAKGKAAKPTA